MTTLLIDGDILLYAAITAGTVSTDWGDDCSMHVVDRKTAREHFEGQVRNYEREIGANRSVIALSDHNANWRKEVLPEYKANRKGPKPPGVREIEAWIRETWETFEFPTLEADDVLGLLATGKRIKGDRVIVSADKDLQQIPGFLWQKGEMMECTPLTGDYFHMLQTLTGDAVDNYSGCPGIGAVRARRLLDDVETADNWWPAVVAAYEKAGLEEHDALVQARVARILRAGEYSKKDGVVLWQPPK